MTYFARLTSVALASLLLSACASYLDTPTQKLRVLTPGAEGARCILKTDYARYVAYPPREIHIRRMQEPLLVTCQAPGNREKTIYVYADLNATALTNVATAGVGVAYDQVSGALYEYPSPIIVDFRHTKAEGQKLPAYHNPDTVDPSSQVAEDMRRGHLENPGENAAKKAAKKPKNVISKEAAPFENYKSDIQAPY